MPKNAQNFTTQEFWSNFFKSKQVDASGATSELEPFEWYADFEDLVPHF